MGNLLTIKKPVAQQPIIQYNIDNVIFYTIPSNVTCARAEEVRLLFNIFYYHLKLKNNATFNFSLVNFLNVTYRLYFLHKYNLITKRVDDIKLSSRLKNEMCDGDMVTVTNKEHAYNFICEQIDLIYSLTTPKKEEEQEEEEEEEEEHNNHYYLPTHIIGDVDRINFPVIEQNDTNLLSTKEMILIHAVGNLISNIGGWHKWFGRSQSYFTHLHCMRSNERRMYIRTRMQDDKSLVSLTQLLVQICSSLYDFLTLKQNSSKINNIDGDNETMYIPTYLFWKRQTNL